jgi:signal transduction histidine kinase
VELLWKIISRPRRSATLCLLGVIVLAALTSVCFRLQIDITTAGFLYLIVIVLLSLAGNLICSIITSIVAAGCLDYFFTPPIFSFRVDNPLNVAAIVAFLTTSSVISWLVSEVRSISQALSSASRKLVDAEEQESNRIARDLHDDVAQRLAILATELEQLQQNLPDSASELRTDIGAMQKRTLQIAAEVGAISHELQLRHFFLGAA